jgi:hypothetical protein
MIIKPPSAKPHWTGSNGVSSPSRRSFMRSAIALAVLGQWPRAASAIDLWKTYQTPEAFILETFAGAPPPAKVANGPSGVRVRYWRAGGRTAWILDDVGKEGYQMTTAGFIVKAGAIELAKVLVYRESRGEQVALPAFLNKFTGARLAGGGLDRSIDNISGATLSVLLMQRMARTALTLDAATP